MANLLLWFVLGLVVVYLAALVYNQGRPNQDCLRSWDPLLLWVVVFVFGCGVYFILVVPKKTEPFDVRDVAGKQGQKMLPPPATNGESSTPAKAEVSNGFSASAPSGVLVANETNDDMTVEGVRLVGKEANGEAKYAVTSTRVVSAHGTHEIRCLAADGLLLRVKGEVYDFRFGGQPWYKARITSGGVISEPLS